MIRGDPGFPFKTMFTARRCCLFRPSCTGSHAQVACVVGGATTLLPRLPPAVSGNKRRRARAKVSPLPPLPLRPPPLPPPSWISLSVHVLLMLWKCSSTCGASKGFLHIGQGMFPSNALWTNWATHVAQKAWLHGVDTIFLRSVTSRHRGQRSRSSSSPYRRIRREECIRARPDRFNCIRT